MNFLFDFLPNLPWPMIEVLVNVVAGLGALLLTYGVFLEAEKRQDIVFIIGGSCLFVYALWISNKIFAIGFAGFTVASTVELVEILIGRHKHSQKMIEDFKNPNGK